MTTLNGSNQTLAARAFSLFARLTIPLLIAGIFVRASGPLDGMTPLALTPGAPEGAYHLTGLDSVNMFNGGLSFHLPLVQIAGRGAAQAPLVLRIEQKWHADQVFDPVSGGFIQFANDQWWSGGSRTSSVPRYTVGSLLGRVGGWTSARLAC
jgi:hypothetical protein